jgi:signal transduction histidine kinase
MTNVMKTEKKPRKKRADILSDAQPQFERFLESREGYIKALETTIEALRQDNVQVSKNTLEMRSSLDELVAMQRLSNIISTSMDKELILSTLIQLTKDVIPVIESNIFLLDRGQNRFLPLSCGTSERLQEEVEGHLEAGIIDWVLAEKKTVVIPDLKHLGENGSTRHFVIVPLVIRNEAIGMYVIHTPKAQPEFSNQDIQLLTVLANQAAAGVENWRTYEQLALVNEELKASQAQMIQAAKLAAIGELSANIVHEIKNPVQVLMMSVELMQSGRSLPNWNELVTTQVKRLSQIVKRLMNFARASSDEYILESVDVNKAIDEIVAMVKNEYYTGGIDITLKLADEHLQVDGNATYLQQVLLNLLINSKDAMPHGGAITIVTEKLPGHVRIRLTDTGSGIEKHLQEKIFTPFFTTKGEGKGTGLGLSICQKIVSQFKGDITLESEIGKGTTFIITLPAV